MSMLLTELSRVPILLSPHLIAASHYCNCIFLYITEYLAFNYMVSNCFVHFHLINVYYMYVCVFPWVGFTVCTVRHQNLLSKRRLVIYLGSMMFVAKMFGETNPDCITTLPPSSLLSQSRCPELRRYLLLLKVFFADVARRVFSFLISAGVCSGIFPVGWAGQCFFFSFPFPKPLDIT